MASRADRKKKTGCVQLSMVTGYDQVITITLVSINLDIKYKLYPLLLSQYLFAHF